LNPVHCLHTLSLNLNFNIILPYMLRSSKRALSLCFQNKISYAFIGCIMCVTCQRQKLY
jgi:hypothetical protein